jgi:hypothetical protein
MRNRKRRPRKPKLVETTSQDRRRDREARQRREFWSRIHTQLAPLRIRSA